MLKSPIVCVCGKSLIELRLCIILRAKRDHFYMQHKFTDFYVIVNLCA